VKTRKWQVSEAVVNVTYLPSRRINMIKFITRFFNEQDGAVTVDWVVLTAAVVGLSVAAVATVQDGVGNLAGAIDTGVSSTSVNTGD
jgi:Flp pilus assembly pilin Flp